MKHLHAVPEKKGRRKGKEVYYTRDHDHFLLITAKRVEDTFN